MSQRPFYIISGGRYRGAFDEIPTGQEKPMICEQGDFTSNAFIGGEPNEEPKKNKKGK